MTAEDKRVALVTGANRGIGLAVATALARGGLRVIMCSRYEDEGARAARALRDDGLDASSHALDVTDEASVRALSRHVADVAGRVDVLVNNAGVFLDDPSPAARVDVDVEMARLRSSIEVNAWGAHRVSRALLPLMLARRYGRIVNVSSILSQSADAAGSWIAYRVSKATLNALTRALAAEVHGANVTVNAVCPGRVRTRMGGANAPLSPEQGADTIVWLATHADGGPTGGFFRERRAIPW